MGTYSVSLPTFLWLEDDTFPILVHGTEINIGLHRVEQDQLDPRLGDIRGRLGFERDPLGMLRYSVLSFDLDEAAEHHLLEAFYGDRLSTWSLSPTGRRVKIAGIVSESFLNHFRSFKRDDVIEPMSLDPLALLHYQEGHDLVETRLYGGHITLPPAGMAEPWLTTFKEEIRRGDDPPDWRLAVLDALRTVKRGFPGPGLTAALGALETVFNIYFASEWRAAARKSTREAADELGITRRSIKTIEDVLREGDLRKKIEAYATRHAPDPKWELELNLAIDARNDAVHGGISLPQRVALRHIRAIGDFLEEQHRIFSRVPAPGRPRILDAYAEATGMTAPESLVRLVNQFLVPHGLDAILYTDSPSRPKGPVVDEYGRTLVVWMPLHDRTLTPERLALRLARMAMEFSLRYEGKTPRARVGDPSVDDRGGGYSAVAWALTQAVWEIGIDRVLGAESMSTEIASDIDERAAAIRRQFSAPYDEPGFGTISYYTAHAELTRVASVVSRNRQTRLLAHVATVAPDVAERARDCIELLANVQLADFDSIRDALVCVHDHSPRLWASVVIAEPEAGLHHGYGLTPNPQPIPN